MLFEFIKIYTFLLLILVIVKFFLVLYRMKTGKWQKSINYVISIIEWKKEATKLGALTVIAAVITVLTFKR